MFVGPAPNKCVCCLGSPTSRMDLTPALTETDNPKTNNMQNETIHKPMSKNYILFQFDRRIKFVFVWLVFC